MTTCAEVVMGNSQGPRTLSFFAMDRNLTVRVYVNGTELKDVELVQGTSGYVRGKGCDIFWNCLASLMLEAVKCVEFVEGEWMSPSPSPRYLERAQLPHSTTSCCNMATAYHGHQVEMDFPISFGALAFSLFANIAISIWEPHVFRLMNIRASKNAGGEFQYARVMAMGTSNFLMSSNHLLGEFLKIELL